MDITKDMNLEDDYSWTEAGNEDLTHRRLIDVGAYAGVHEVKSLFYSY